MWGLDQRAQHWSADPRLSGFILENYLLDVLSFTNVFYMQRYDLLRPIPTRPHDSMLILGMIQHCFYAPLGQFIWKQLSLLYYRHQLCLLYNLLGNSHTEACIHALHVHTYDIYAFIFLYHKTDLVFPIKITSIIRIKNILFGT